MDLKLELVLLPVTDVDRAKAFYADRLGFLVHVDHAQGEEFRVVQMDPPGSHCSVTFGVGITDAAPGSVRGTHLVVEDIVAAREHLTGNGLEISEIYHFGASGKTPGAHPERIRYGSFMDFADPDGNTWVVQEVPPGS